MLFQSPEFIFLLLPLTLAGYFLLVRYTARRLWPNVWLFAASAFLYGCFDPKFPLLLFAASAVTYLLGRGMLRAMESPRNVSALMVCGVVLHLGLLFVFKYYDFFAEQIRAATHAEFEALSLLLPVGLSFTTFQQIAYLAQIRRAALAGGSNACTESDFWDYQSYIFFFPKLTQGPITPPDSLLEQMTDTAEKRFQAEDLLRGLMRFILGLAKKVLIADALSGVVQTGYAQTAGIDTISTIVLLMTYAFQLYFDFSGYCDMAVGIARMLRLHLPENFDAPYQAQTIKSLWQRWHMSLSTFFTRYVYIPLGGSRRGRARTLCNVMIVFVLSAVWHGAGWTYLFWGIAEGLFVIAGDLMRKTGQKRTDAAQTGAVQNGSADSGKGRGVKALRVLRTNALFYAGLLFFASADLTQTGQMIRGLFRFGTPNVLRDMASAFSLAETFAVQEALRLLRPGAEHLFNGICFALFMLLCVVLLRGKTSAAIAAKQQVKRRDALLYGLLFAWSLLSLSSVGTFLYFAF